MNISIPGKEHCEVSIVLAWDVEGKIFLDKEEAERNRETRLIIPEYSNAVEKQKIKEIYILHLYNPYTGEIEFYYLNSINKEKIKG